LEEGTWTWWVPKEPIPRFDLKEKREKKASRKKGRKEEKKERAASGSGRGEIF